jgi:predicted nucleotidyltransferase component of viral defense system
MTKRNLAASVRARLLNKATKDGVNFQRLLVRYALERLLYRLSISPEKDHFLLKGALLFDLWYDVPLRPTRDIDLLDFGLAEIPHLVAVFEAICLLEVDDGISFDPKSLRAEDIRKESNYSGTRLTLTGVIDNAKCPVQIDIGFGDAVTPAPELAIYPVMFDDMPAPSLRVYPRYTVVAEKLEAIITLGMANTRMKDYFDLWVILRDTPLDQKILLEAVVATLTNRSTKMPHGVPVGLSEQFWTDNQKIIQWNAFVTRNNLTAESLGNTVKYLRDALAVIFQGINV